MKPGGVFVVAERQTYSGVLTLGSAPVYRWTAGWLPRTGCFSLLYIPYCIRSPKHWAPGSCDHSSILLRTPDLQTCNLWREEKGKRIRVVSQWRQRGWSDCFVMCFNHSLGKADYLSEQLDEQNRDAQRVLKQRWEHIQTLLRKNISLSLVKMREITVAVRL